MPSWHLYCPRCGFRGGEGEYYPFCPRCGGPLELRGEPLPGRRRVLGEGSTPLVLRRLGGLRVAFKLEYLNPTGSFKDRGVSASLQLASSLGYECAVVDSSGNTALSTAAYAAALGLRARLHVPATAAPGKLDLARALGAEVVVHQDRAEAAAAARREARECFYVAHQYSPVFLWGMESLGLELAEFDGWDFYVPVSSGSLLLGLWRGLRRAGARGRIIAVQAAEAASLRGRARLLAEVGGPTSRLADALVLRDPPRLDEIAGVVRESGGGLVVVGDDAIREALRGLLRLGFIVEPSSAAAWAAFTTISRAGGARDSVIVLTGSGLKYAGRLAEAAKA